MHPLVYKARRVLTLDPSRPEIVDAGLVVQAGRIVELGPWSKVKGCGPVHDLGSVTLVPALINAHTHLELSHLAGKIDSGQGFMAWADQLFAQLRSAGRPQAMNIPVAALQRQGMAYIVDVCSAPPHDYAHLEQAHIGVLALQEYAGRMRANITDVALGSVWSLAAHALYSTQAELVVLLKRRCEKLDRVFSLHLAEVPGENELFLYGRGELGVFLRSRRLLPKGFVAPGLSAVAYADALGLLDARTLAVHSVQVSEADIGILAQSGAHVCLCLRSNSWIGVGQAPVAALHTAGVPLCLGTDSLASNADLDLWAELRAVRELLPDLPLTALLAMVTRIPARLLGLDADYGCLALGMRGRWAMAPEDFANLPV